MLCQFKYNLPAVRPATARNGVSLHCPTRYAPLCLVWNEAGHSPSASLRTEQHFSQCQLKYHVDKKTQGTQDLCGIKWKVLYQERKEGKEIHIWIFEKDIEISVNSVFFFLLLKIAPLEMHLKDVSGYHSFHFSPRWRTLCCWRRLGLNAWVEALSSARPSSISNSGKNGLLTAMIYSKLCVALWWLPIYTMPSAEAILCALPTPVIGTKHFHNTPPNPGLFWWGSWGFSEHAGPRGSWESHQHFQLQPVPCHCKTTLPE